jgi:hypothetical protein
MKDSRVLFLKAIMGEGVVILESFYGEEGYFHLCNSIDCSLRWLFFIYCMMLTLYDEDGKGRLERKAGRQDLTAGKATCCVLCILRR